MKLCIVLLQQTERKHLYLESACTIIYGIIMQNIGWPGISATRASVINQEIIKDSTCVQRVFVDVSRRQRLSRVEKYNVYPMSNKMICAMISL